jgi:hypothetical protein
MTEQEQEVVDLQLLDPHVVAWLEPDDAEEYESE